MSDPGDAAARVAVRVAAVSELRSKAVGDRCRRRFCGQAASHRQQGRLLHRSAKVSDGAGGGAAVEVLVVVVVMAAAAAVVHDYSSASRTTMVVHRHHRNHDTTAGQRPLAPPPPHHHTQVLRRVRRRVAVPGVAHLRADAGQGDERRAEAQRRRRRQLERPGAGGASAGRAGGRPVQRLGARSKTKAWNGRAAPSALRVGRAWPGLRAA